MKVNKLTKIIIIIIVLSISITITASKLGYINKSIDSANSTPTVDEQSIINEVTPPVEIANKYETNNQVSEDNNAESPIMGNPIMEEPLTVENPIVDEVIQSDDSNTKEDPNTNLAVKGATQDTSKEDNPNSNTNNKPNNASNSNNDNGKNGNDDKIHQSIVASKIISKDKVIEIGLKKIGSKAKLIDIKSYLGDNPPTYIMTISKNKSKYKIEIHAKTGAILDYKKE